MTRAELFTAIRPFAPGQSFTPAMVTMIDDLADRFGLPRLESKSLAPSQAIIDYVKGVETLAKLRPDGKVEAYMPTPNDRPTIGYGTTGPEVKMGTVWTRDQAEARFASHFAEFAGKVSAILGKTPTTQGQFDALVSLAYNIGTQGLSDSTLMRLHKEGDYAGAADQFARWNKQAGVVLNGLTKRRAVEASFYRGQK